MKCRRHLLVILGKWDLKARWQLQLTPARAKPPAIPGTWAEKWGKGTHLQSQVTMSSVSASGCRCQPRPGSNNQGYVQRKGIAESTVRRSRFIFLTPDIYQDERSVDRPSQVLLTVGTKPPGLQGRRLGTSLWLGGACTVRPLAPCFWVSLHRETSACQ